MPPVLPAACFWSKNEDHLGETPRRWAAREGTCYTTLDTRPSRGRYAPVYTTYMRTDHTDAGRAVNLQLGRQTAENRHSGDESGGSRRCKIGRASCRERAENTRD